MPRANVRVSRVRGGVYGHRDRQSGRLFRRLRRSRSLKLLGHGSPREHRLEFHETVADRARAIRRFHLHRASIRCGGAVVIQVKSEMIAAYFEFDRCVRHGEGTQDGDASMQAQLAFFRGGLELHSGISDLQRLH